MQYNLISSVEEESFLHFPFYRNKNQIWDGYKILHTYKTGLYECRI